MAAKKKPKVAKAYKGVGGGFYVNTKKGSAREGKKFRIAKNNAHVYDINGKRVSVGGLSPAQMKKRQLQIDDNTIYNPASPLTGSSLRAALADLVDGETQPGIREINNQITTGRAQGRVLDDRAAAVFKGIDDATAAAQTRQQGITAGNKSALQAIAGGAANANQAQGAQNSANAAADAAQRGPGLGGGGAEAVQAELAAQAARGGQIAQNYQTFGANENANYEGYQNALRSANVARGAEARQGIAQTTAKNERDLLAKRADIVSQEGPLRTKLLLQLRQAGFDQLATQLGLNIKQSDITASQQQAADALAFKQKDAKDQRDFLAGQNAANRDQSNTNNIRSNDPALHPKSGSGSTGALTPAQKRSAQKDYEKAVGAIRTFKYGAVKGTTKTAGKPGTSLEKLLQSNPKKWRPIVIRQLQAKYGYATAKKAVDRVIKTKPKKKKAGSLLGGLL